MRRRRVVNGQVGSQCSASRGVHGVPALPLVAKDKSCQSHRSKYETAKQVPDRPEPAPIHRPHRNRGGGVSVVPRHVLGGAKFVAPSEKVNIAIIGCGGQGRTNVRTLFNEPYAQIIAVADPIESENLDAFYYKGNGGRLPVKAEIEKHYAEKTPNFKVADYEDFRVMLEKEKAIDAILCATPDHQHAYVCVMAMRQGKHVYCEKPLTHNVWEARLVARVAKETGVATQLGNQGHSGDFIRQTCEMIWDGAIGDVREVHAWTNASRWNTQDPRWPAPGGGGPEWGQLGFVAGAAGEPAL